MVVDNNVVAGLSQLFWADAVFVRDFSRLEELDEQQLLAMAAIVHDCYNSWDLTLHLLNEVDRRKKGELGPNYLSMLSGQPRSSADVAPAA
jgi:hypothetical protein